MRGYCIEVLAGPLAEERFNPLFEPRVGANAFGQVGFVLERVERDNFKRRRKLAGFIKDATHSVEENGTSITSLAFALFGTKTIHSDAHASCL